jgi:bifunctional non-homologous end joining protein LigD
MLAYKDGRRVRLISRNAVDHTWRFPDLSAAIANLKTEVAVLDGEVAVFDETLVSRFHLLNDDSSGVIATPPVFIVFDVLQAGAQDLRSQPLAERRRLLEDLTHDVEFVLPCRRLPENGSKAWDIVVERGYEGLVAKDSRSTYRQGSTRAWVKLKVRHESVFIVGGIRDIDAFDGVLVGEHIGDQLHYRGVVEWGFRAADVLELLREVRMFRRQTSPFADLSTMRGAVWLEPRLRAEVSYAEVIAGRLRAPSWRSLVRAA